MEKIINKKTCAIIVPSFNEEGKIKEAVHNLSSFCAEQKDFTWILVFVDDGSSDSSKQKILESKEKVNNSDDKSIKFVSVFLEKNQGKGAAIQAGLKSVETDFYGYLDVDLSVDYKKAIPQALNALSVGGFGVVAGERQDFGFSGYSWLRRFGSAFFNFISRSIFRLPFHDVQCGFKFFNNDIKNLALKVERTRFSFDLELLSLVHISGFLVKQISIFWDHKDASSVSWQDAVRYLLDTTLISELVIKKRVWNFLYFLFPFIITFVLFGWTMKFGYFFSDDFTWLWHGWKILTGEITVFGAHMSTFYSPVLNAFYAFSVGIFNSYSAYYFFIGLMVHVCNSFLVGLLARDISKSYVTGLFATMLFALAGSAYEPLVWIGANMHSFAVFFMLLSCLFLVKYYNSIDKKNQIICLSTSFLSLVLAFGTKEISMALPVLLFTIGVYFRLKNKDKVNFAYIIYWVLFFSTTLMYIIKQYVAQHQSIWLTSGSLSFSPQLLARIPIAIMDVFVPLNYILSEKTAWLIFSVALSFLIFVFYKFRDNILVRFGFLWALLAVGVVVFFNFSNWWEILPSRYTYSVRVGVIFIISAVLTELIRKARYLRVVQSLFWVLILSIFLQFYNMAGILRNEYSYVYDTGRSLSAVVEEIAVVQPDRIFVEWDRPFEKNFAHVVGLLEYKAQIPENRIVFLEKDQIVEPAPGEVILHWDMERNIYIIIKSE